MDTFAHLVGKRFLEDDEFLDNLVDALDGVELESELSETDSDMYATSDEEEDVAMTDESGDSKSGTSNSEELASPGQRRKTRRATRAEAEDSSGDGSS